MSKQKDQFIALLGELFQLNQPELDFGLYRILHARSAQIKAFIDTELGSEIDAHFAEQSQSNAHDSLEAARVKVAETLGEDAFLPTGELKPEYRGTKVGKEFELAQQQARDGGGLLADDAQVYEHLYRFFSRYYDKGDFMSKRYFVAENDSRAAPYAVPYDGREVMLHWANKDQYYIKSSEALSNFTFDLSTAQAKEQGQQSGFDFQPVHANPLKVHFRLAAAAEGEHNNVKESQERFFIIHDSQALQLEVNDQGQTELVVQFDYRPDTEKSGQAGTWQQKRLAEAEQVVAEQLENLLFAHPELRPFQELLFTSAPTDKQPNRTLLGKYLGQFTARNTMDYFIHKNLGGFLRRELDFYIKNEIIRLDDIEAADAPRVDEYLKKLRVLRKIARRIIDFLAQLEDFQKKLWLKKKFVVETQYCITLDRIPESFYPEIAANEQQRAEWVKLFAIDQIEDNISQAGYSAPLTINFLKENQFLVIDTSLFPEQFKHELIAKLDKLDENTTGNLLHSDNQQGLNLISEKFKNDIDCIFIDPPYNTGNDGFIYKDAYCHSSWLSFARSRIEAAKPLLSESGYFGATIDFVESSRLKLLLDEIFSEESFLADIAWEKRYTRSNNAKKFYSLKDQLLVYGNIDTFKERRTESSLDNYSNPDKDPRGAWISSSYVNPATREARPNLSYEIVNPYTQEKISHPTHAWKYDKRVHLQHVQDNRLYWGEAGDYTYPRLKSFLSEASENMVPVDIWKHQETGTTDAGGAELKSMFGKSVFDNPKPTSLISRFVRLVADNKEPRHVIDFFAGSGSTGHALINLSRQACNKKYTLIEMGAHFDSVLKPRLQKSIYSKDWSEGKPISREGISHFLKYIRLESFEDTLNNLQLPDTPRLNVSTTDSSEMVRDYLLKYWLEFETAGSPSLLNVREFSDPTSYKLKVKQPGSDAQIEKTIDLVETFNWLIGLHVAHLDQPRRYAIELVREADPELPQDQDTRWRATAIKEREDGEFWFRAVEGHVLRVPGDELSRERVLVIWRKLTGNSSRDQAALEAWLGKRGINPRESEFATIYVNGNHALPSDGEAAMRVSLIEETFAQRMWEGA
ncbi:site-specific DNA-methyltransferase [Pseudomonas guariconensis]|uniref:site-specific DNA-methyltransferase n=1 Tax=Pseudomonas guariconensis TaxID=1288410 RepID=UPI00387180B1